MGLSTCILLDERLGGWPRWEELVLRRLAPARVVPVADAEAAQAAAFEAAMAGCERLIAADGPGGAAVCHGLVNGVMRLAESHRRRLRVGPLSLGRPGALQRSLELPRDLSRQLDVLSAGHTLPLDVGRIECARAGASGPAVVTRYFLCGAWLGHGARHADAAGSASLGLLRRAVELLGGLAQPAPRVRLLLDDRLVYEGPWSAGGVMGARHYPGLGRLAPDADPMDGALDAWWFPGALPTLLARLPGLWLEGRPAFFPTGLLPAGLLPAGLLPAPQRARTRRVRVEALESAGRPICLEADGQPVGQLPATLTLIPKALPVISEAIAIRLGDKQRVMLAELQGSALAGHAAPRWARPAVG